MSDSLTPNQAPDAIDLQLVQAVERLEAAFPSLSVLVMIADPAGPEGNRMSYATNASGADALNMASELKLKAMAQAE